MAWVYLFFFAIPKISHIRGGKNDFLQKSTNFLYLFNSVPTGFVIPIFPNYTKNFSNQMRKTDFLPKGMKGHDVISFSWHLLEIGFGSSGQTDSYTWYLIDTFFRVWYFKGIYMAQKYLLIADSLKRTIDISPHEKCLA